MAIAEWQRSINELLPWFKEEVDNFPICSQKKGFYSFRSFVTPIF